MPGMLNIVLVMVLTGVLFAPTGVLLWPIIRRRYPGRVTALGVGLALQVVVYSAAAAVFDYHLWLQLGLWLALNVGLGVMLFRSGRLPDLLLYWPKLARWQWGLIGVVALGYLGPALVIPVPFDTDAQGFGLMVATVAQSGSITTLAPYYPEIGWFYSPAYFLLTAMLDMISGAAVHQGVLGFSHLVALLLLGLISDLGAQWLGEDRRWAVFLAAAIPNVIFTTLMDSAYTNIFGNALTAVFLILLGPAFREGKRGDVALAGVALGSVLLGHPDSIIHLLLAYIPVYATIWLAKERPTWPQYLRLAVVIPALGVLVALPWIVRVVPLIPLIGVHERQNPQLNHLMNGLVFGGLVVPLLAVAGVWWSLKRRAWSDVWLLTWLVPIIEVSALGNLNRLSLMTEADPMQIFYPLGVIWHATIIPLPLLAAQPLAALGDWLGPKWAAAHWRRLATVGLSAVALVGLAMLVMAESIMASLQGRNLFVGAAASRADLAAYAWIRENTPEDATLLNYPGRYEGHWATVIPERRSVFIRDQLFYLEAEGLRETWPALEEAYLDPVNHREVLQAAGVDYVVVPQSHRRPDANPWRPKPPDLRETVSDWRDVPWATLVFEQDGAEVWQVE